MFLQPLLARHRARIEQSVEDVSEAMGVAAAHIVRTGRKASMQYLRRGELWMEKLRAPSPNAATAAAAGQTL